MMKIKDFTTVGRFLFEEGIVHAASGNMSVRDEDVFYITAHDTSFAGISPENIVKVNVADDRLDAGASVEVKVHREIYRACDARAIVHAHPTFAVILSFFMEKIMPQDVEGNFYLPEIPVVFSEESIGGIRLGVLMADALKKYPAAVLKGHGSWVVGKTLFDCWKITSVLESSSRILYHKMLLEKWRKDV